MYFVNKGGKRVSVKDKDSATAIIYTLTILGCTEPLSTQNLIGNKEDIDIYTVDFCGKTISAFGVEDAKTIMSWMLSLGCRKVTIEKAGESEDANNSLPRL